LFLGFPSFVIELSSADSKPPDEPREQGVHGARVEKCPPGRLWLAGPGGQRDVERCRRFSLMAASRIASSSLRASW